MDKWTPEPWVVHLKKRAIVPLADAGKIVPLAADDCVEGMEVAHTIFLFRDPSDTMPEDETYANAFRACECVNALTGLNPAAIPELVGAIQSEVIPNLVAIRATLADENWEGAPEHCAELAGDTIALLNAALAKVKGGAS